MAMTMREKMARAMDPVGWEWHDRAKAQEIATGKPHPAIPIFLSVAFKAVDGALSALAEPTEAMVDAAAGYTYPRVIFRAMIDAAKD